MWAVESTYNIRIFDLRVDAKAGHSGNNLASNIMHPKISFLMWQVVTKERDDYGKIICCRLP